ncbi:MAG: hypothetical protein WAW41_16155 [Methylobacter sp.]
MAGKRVVQGSAKQKSPTILALEKALAQVGSDPLLQMKLENLPPDYSYTQTKDDEEILDNALQEKLRCIMQTQAIRFKDGWYIKELPGVEDIQKDTIMIDVAIAEQDMTELDYKQQRGLAATEQYMVKRNREELRKADINRNLAFRKKHGIVSTNFSEAMKAL